MYIKSIAALITCFSTCSYAVSSLSPLTSELPYHDNNKQAFTMVASPSSHLNLLPDGYAIDEVNYTSNHHALMLSQAALTFDDTKPLPRYLDASNQKDWDYLLGQTYTILGLSVVTAATMTLLPESITKWDKESRSLKGLGKKWKDHVTEGPVWDRDEHILNYVMHPYFGGVYYTAARHSGFNEFESFLYSATMSTFFWEFGVEAFAEVPSWQDIFITPFLGSVVGEMMFEAEQSIVMSGGEVWGSETMGDISLFFLNPVGHIHGWVSSAWGGSAEFQFVNTPYFGNHSAASYAAESGARYDSVFYGAQLKITF